MSEPTHFAQKELWELICGNVLGQGSARTVYEHRLDPCLVVKNETERGSFQNVLEWEIWERVKGTEHARWFAPCVAISACGGILIQRRTDPTVRHPEMIPNFLTDTKLTNFGILRTRPDEPQVEQFVAHDYGYTRLIHLGLSRRLVKASWWNAHR